MKILHYILGTPPVRGGGLVKYALDLAEAQNKEDDVYLLIPGPISFIEKRRKKISIKRKGKWKGIPQYKIYNPLPIPMGNGVLDIKKYIMTCNTSQYRKFLTKVKPDVVHVHSLMGIHKEFLLEANDLGIPVIYTTHDYFGICPAVNLFYQGKICEEPGKHCGECSRYAFSEKRLLIEQSTIYRLYRNNNFLIRILQANLFKNFMGSLRSKQPDIMNDTKEKQNDICESKSISSQDEYDLLQTYYREMFGLISYFHFNSTISKQVYEKHLGDLLGQVISISNKSVEDKRKLHYATDKLKVGFLGGDADFKGLQRLQNVIGELYTEGKNQIELQVYGSLKRKEYPFCKYFDAYKEDERSKVFEQMDILAVPSAWMETFGMVVLEALSYGVPVILTDKVGAKMLLEESQESFGAILPDTNKAWKEYLDTLYEHKEQISFYSKNICEAEIELQYEEHVKKIRNMLNAVMAKRK